MGISYDYDLIFKGHICMPAGRISENIIIPVCDFLIMLDFKGYSWRLKVFRVREQVQLYREDRIDIYLQRVDY